MNARTQIFAFALSAIGLSGCSILDDFSNPEFVAGLNSAIAQQAQQAQYESQRADDPSCANAWHEGCKNPLDPNSAVQIQGRAGMATALAQGQAEYDRRNNLATSSVSDYAAASQPAPSAEQGATSPSARDDVAAATKPLVFSFYVGVDKLLPAKDGGVKNGACYSTVVSIPGPPGWGSSKSDEQRAAAEAIGALIQPYRSRFEAACGRQGRISGSASAMTNQYGEGDPQRQYANGVAEQMIIIPLN